MDYERGRTVLNWRPRRFGGGRGYLRMTKEEIEELDRQEKIKRRELKERDRSRSDHKRHRSRDRERGEKKEKK